MKSIQKLTNEELLGILKNKQSVKSPRNNQNCLTYLIRSGTNLNDEIKSWIKKSSNWKHGSNLDYGAGDNIPKMLKTLEKEGGVPGKGILILMYMKEMDCFELNDDLKMSISPKYDRKYLLDEVIVKISDIIRSKNEEVQQSDLNQFVSNLKQEKEAKVDLIPDKMNIMKLL